MPVELSANNFTVLQVYREDPEEAAREGREPKWSFLKRNCMHCNVPACASACPVAALSKTAEGPVLYDESRCIGCRYCMLACPFQVPRYEWLDWKPRVRKCDWNRACVKACPVGALVEGPRKAMLEEAHRRIEAEPDRYVDHVYGEHEAGGTSYLILAAVDHEKLDLPSLPPTVRSSIADPIMEALPGWIIGLGLALGAVYKLTHGERSRDGEGHPAASSRQDSEPAEEEA